MYTFRFTFISENSIPLRPRKNVCLRLPPQPSNSPRGRPRPLYIQQYFFVDAFISAYIQDSVCIYADIIVKTAAYGIFFNNLFAYLLLNSG